jgi:serine/threonine protein kinase
MGPMTLARRPAARRLGRYLVGERIGSGGIGEVFAATTEGHDGFDKPVVIKMLRQDLAATPELAAALVDEANVARRLAHGNIVQVLDLGETGGQAYVVLEHVDGASLQALLDDLDARGERMPLSTSLFVVDQIAAALDHAHRFTDEAGLPAPVIHRDVKPANVLVSTGGVVKLTDFGIAKAAGRQGHTLVGAVKGTPLFLAPEQAAGGSVDARADVFGLGRVLQWLVLGPPGSPRERAAEGVDAELRAIVARALADDPAQRTPDIDTLREQLHAWCARAHVRPIAGPLGDLVRRLRRDPPRKRAIAIDAALLHDSPRHATAHAQPPAPAPSSSRTRIVLLAVLSLSGALAAVWLSSRPLACGVADRAEALHAQAPEPAVVDPPALVPGRRAGADAEPPPEMPASAAIDEATATDAAIVGDAKPPSSDRVPVRKGKARLRVNLMPYADVWLDGRPLGRTPVNVRVAAGTARTLVLEHPKIGKKTREIDLPAGGDVSIEKW